MRFSSILAAGLLATLACSSKSTTQKTPNTGGAGGAAAAAGTSGSGGSSATGGSSGTGGAPSGGGVGATGGSSGSSGASGSGGASGSSGASGSGGGPSGGAAGSSGAGGSAGASAEICDDGADNDKNGQTDCADAACTTHECVAAVPANWNGPVHLFVGAGPPPPACTGTIAIEGGEGALSAAPVTCSACSCAPPGGGGTCVPDDPVAFYQSASCGSATTLGTATIDNCEAPSKVGFPTQVNPKSTFFTAIKANGFSCTSSGGGLDQVPTPSFKNGARACNMPAGKGCSSGDVCVAKPKTPFAAGSCIYKSGDVGCPSVGMTKTIVYTTYADNRSCTACSCNAPTGCGGTMEMYDAVSCGGTMTSKPLPANGGCIGQAAAIASYKLVNFTPSACAKAGGQPTGTITETGPRTVCCWP